MKTLFSAPSLGTFAVAIGRLQTEQGARAAGEHPARVVPRPEDRHLPFPLTDVQQAYWIGRSGAVELGQVATHVYLELEVAELDLPRLERAFRRLIDRHDMLRAVVLPNGTQRVLESVPPYEISAVDLRTASPETAERELAAKQGADPRAGDAERVTRAFIDGENERVGEYAADGACTRTPPMCTTDLACAVAAASGSSACTNSSHWRLWRSSST